MADDIDIEEHDILQNPLMKHYLSDLDIKHEIEDGENYAPDRIGTPENIKRENSPTLANDDDQVDEVSNNKIIVGSNSSTERYTDPKLDSNTVVLLEDWSELLHSNICYCKECQTLFPTQNAIDAHNMASHSFLVAKETEENVPDGTLCQHCNNYFDNDSLIKHMYEIIEGNTNKTSDLGNAASDKRKSDVSRAIAVKRTSRGIENDTQPSDFTAETAKPQDLYYTCPICAFVYKNLNNMHLHTQTFHSHTFDDLVPALFQRGCKFCDHSMSIKFHNNHIKYNHTEEFTRKFKSNVSNDESKQETRTKKVSVKRPDNDAKKPLYKCNRCKTTYINYYSAMNHNKIYHKGEKTMVYVGPKDFNPKHRAKAVSKQLPKDVLFKCPHCPLHFLNTIVAMAHLRSKHNRHKQRYIPNEVWNCRKCKRSFRKRDKTDHELQHKANAEFRCYECREDIYPLVLCKCKCNVYLEELVLLKHEKYGCRDSASEFCDTCNISVNNLTVHYGRHHTPNSNFILIHEYLNRTISDTDSSSSESNLECSNKRKPSDRLEAETKKTKRDSIASSKILYKCQSCEVIYDLYDNVVEHCQKHINDDNYKPDMRQCKICSLKSESTCLNDHKNLGEAKILSYDYSDLFKDTWLDFLSSMPRSDVHRIRKDSKYVTLAVKMNMILDGAPKLTMYKCDKCKNYVDASEVFIHTHECQGVAGNLACESCGIKFCNSRDLETHELIHNDADITANSYRIVTFNNKSDKTFNLKLKKFYDDSSSERDSDKFVFYQCRNCRSSSLYAQFMSQHNKCLNKQITRECGKCDYVTSMYSMWAHVEWHDQNKNLSRDDITFVPFGEASVTPKKYTYFQCKICKVLLANKEHDCGAGVKAKCPDCDYLFTIEELTLHAQRHLNDKDMTIDSIVISVFEGSDGNGSAGDNAPQTETLYKCASCKCIFLTKTDFCGHHKKQQCLVNKRTTCGLCGLHFNAKAMAIHKKKHESGVAITPNIVTLNKSGIKDYTLYKCDKCKIHFVNRATFRLHIKRGHNNSIGKCCSACGIKFGKISYGLHVSMHHEKKNYKREDFNIVCPKLMKSDRTAVTNIMEPDNTAIRRSTRPRTQKKTFDDDYDENSDESHSDNDIIPSTSEANSVGKSIPASAIKKTDISVKTMSEKKKAFDDDEENSDETHSDSDSVPSTPDATPVDKSILVSGIKKSVMPVKTANKDNKANNDDEENSDESHSESEIVAFASDKTPADKPIPVTPAKKPVKTAANTSKITLGNKITAVYLNIEYDNTLLKCTCGVHFLKESALVVHWKAPCRAENRMKVVTCSECNHKFTQASLVRHKNIHHKLMKLKPRDFIVIPKMKGSEENNFNKDNLNIRCVKKTNKGKTANKRNSLYECAKCHYYYLSKSSIYRHFQSNHVDLLGLDVCKKCNLKFTKHTLARHMRYHHINLKYKLKDFHIFEVTESCKKKVNIDYTESREDTPVAFSDNASNNGGTQSKRDIIELNSESDHGSTDGMVESVSDASDADESTRLKRKSTNETDTVTAVNKNKHAGRSPKRRDIRKVIDVVNLEDIDETVSTDNSKKHAGIEDSSTAEKSVNNESNDLVNLDNGNLDTKLDKEIEESLGLKLFQCEECNVYFIEQKDCCEHVSDHTPLDPYDYIECKLCNLQFQIEYLKTHIQKHHSNKDFHLDKVLVDVYEPSDGEPKFRTFYAKDKVQSRLVSTTTDDQKEKISQPLDK